MNVSARTHALIIGIGNPLRSDDGLGWKVAEQLSQDDDMCCDIHMVHQLTPELAQWMAAADLTIMVDASREGELGELRVRPLSPSAQPGPIGTHYTTPEELAALTTTVYGHCPPVVVVTMTGANFCLGERLSPIISQSIPLVCAAVRQVCTCDLALIMNANVYYPHTESFNT
ncbi:hydrogenase maturation protease [Reticulibacter mediterranei]|uniref:Hydrogenase maturation protease n=1 Tax=Reticulibacter mediterranei TaxID=2778369 RepID=A0A8J3IXX1_9CHLR|nr:hydrogenase maturation protease [Reticulibacter mediterranei]GHO99949.1 hydrogenase maturation protease [Reticulibacter mediterranei]